MTSWLIDKSALVRLAESAEAAQWAERIERGLVSICSVTLLELGFSARSAAEHARQFESVTVRAMPVDYLTPAIEDRALAVQRALAERGQHRAPSVPDLIIAAAGELVGRTILHLDKDFELIAALTGQDVERLRLAE